MKPDERPLPESLTRLLSVPLPAVRARSWPAELVPPPNRASRHAALESVLLRGFVYGVSGLVWLAVMLLIARHIAW
ncbi:hypothetical protein [Methylobacterium phyllostachyos]|uniref:hypothetical protein n=1 Tax=Methylobacterium phyllostachyos TaxID=582672 RepID=UPI000B8388DE|nr:hypothetical protein [Methylobacterium phyllostachyos]